MTNFETDSPMKMPVENFLNQPSGKKDDVVPIAVIINPVKFKAQAPGPGYTNVIIAGDNLQ